MNIENFPIKTTDFLLRPHAISDNLYKDQWPCDESELKKRLFKEVFNEDNPDDLLEVAEGLLLIQFLKTESKNSSGIDLPESYIEGTKFDNRIGRVLAIGPNSYDPDQFPNGPKCKIGDWIVFWRHDYSFINVNGVECAFLPCGKLLCTTKKPKSICTHYHMGK